MTKDKSSRRDGRNCPLFAVLTTSFETVENGIS